jgi:hypothetical protein
MGAYCGAFRTAPCIPQSLNHSWAAPLVAPAPSRSDPVAEPSEYKFASRAPVIRRSPGSKHPRPKNAHQGKLPVPFANGKLNVSSCGYRTQSQKVPQQQNPHSMRTGDMDNQYDDFLASFQHRIDGMTGQKGGWGF